MAVLNPEWFWLRERSGDSERGPPASEAEIAGAEERLGVKLPASYLALFRVQNGGYPDWSVYWSPAEDVYWSDVFIDGPYEIERLETMRQVADGIDFGSESDDWSNYLADMHLLVAIASHGCDWYTCLDYRKCGPAGEPEVVYLDTCSGPQIRHRIKDFSTLLAGLCMNSEDGFEIVIRASGDDRAEVLAAVEKALAVKLEPAAGGGYTAEAAGQGIGCVELKPSSGFFQRLLPDARWQLRLLLPGKLNKEQARALDRLMTGVLAGLGYPACVMAVPEAYVYVEKDEGDTPGFIAAYLKVQQKEAEAGDVGAMQILAKAYGDWDGWYAPKGYPVDMEQSRAWFERALQTLHGRVDGDAERAPFAMRGLAEAYEKGYGVAVDMQQALHWYQRAAERRDRWAMLCLGRIYTSGEGVARNLELAEYWLREAKDIEDDTYVNLLLQDIESRKNMVQLYGYGQAGTEDMDDEERLAFYRQLAESGDIQAMRELAKIHFLGLYQVPKDDGQGVEWLRRAATARPLRGRGSSERESHRWSREAAEDLAEVYEYGHLADFPRNPAEALRWHRHAAGLGSRWGMAWIAEGYLDGTFSVIDPVMAYVWMEIATRPRYDGEELEYEEIGERLAQIRAMLDAGQLQQAREWVAKCVDASPHPLPDDLGAPLVLAQHDTPALSATAAPQAAGASSSAPESFEEGARHYLSAEYAEAMQEFRVAAEGGHVRAMIEIAKMHAAGKGVPANTQEAARWYRRAAEAQNDDSARGSSAAMAWLGYAHGVGLLGEPDPALGYIWYSLAGRPRYNRADANTEQAVQAWLNFVQDQRERFAGMLSEEQRVSARQVLESCDNGPPFQLP